MAHGRCPAATGLLGGCHADGVTVPRVVALTAFFVLIATPPAALAAECTGAPDEVRPLSLTVAGETATGLYPVPAARPRGLVVFGHGAANTSDSWRRHPAAVAQREGVSAVAMDYRGMEVTGVHEERGTVTARGWPAKAGAEDLVAAAQHFDRTCPGLAGIVLYGVSMGGNMTGLAVAAQAKRADGRDRKSTRLNSSHANISYAVFCLKKKIKTA